MKKEKHLTPKMLESLHIYLVSKILETAPNICNDFLAFDGTPKTLVPIWKTLQAWLDRSIKAGLPFAEPLRRIYFDLPPKTFEAIAGCSQERQRDNASDSPGRWQLALLHKTNGVPGIISGRL